MFSVVVPAYNHYGFLVSCLHSALRSPLVSEVLVVDDGSADRSRLLLERLAGQYPRMRLLRDRVGQNLGADARLNALVRQASQDWIAVLNSDDEFVAGRFEAIERSARRGTADLFFGDLIMIGEEGERHGLRRAARDNEFPWPDPVHAAQTAAAGRWVELLLQQNIVATTTNMVFRRGAFERVGGFRKYRYCHDWDFALRVALTGTVCYAPLMMSRYRVHPGNTIRERRSLVVAELRRMLERIGAEFPAVGTDARLQSAMGDNTYLGMRRTCWLDIVKGDDLAFIAAESSLPAGDHGTRFITAPSGNPSDSPYRYAPGAGVAWLSANDLRNLHLAVRVRSYDVLLVSRSMAPAPAVGAGSARDLMIYSKPWAEGGVARPRARLVRLLPEAGEVRQLGDLIDVKTFAIDHAGGNAAETGDPWAEPLTLAADGLGPVPSKPTVFIFPVFLAMGGAERLVVETMRHLTARYHFVVVTTEALTPLHGSMHREALRHAHVYDLAETVRVEDRLTAIGLLKAHYDPVAVWICNGSQWQVANAGALRAMFADTPIIDNQVYDHEEGWINAFSIAEVRSADRYIAINARIRSAMEQRYGIPADRIDMVYHGADIGHLRNAAVPPDRASARARLGLPASGLLFGMVGRLTPQKRPQDLIGLAAAVRRRGDSHQFIWAGPGELRAEMAQLRRDLDAVNFTLLEPMSDVRPLYEALDGLIITSAFEGLPFVMLEALGLGIPVLSTPVGAIEEVLAMYGSGMISGPPGDAAALEARFDEFVAALPELRDAAERGRVAFIEQFRSERMAAEYEASWQTAITALNPEERKTEP